MYVYLDRLVVCTRTLMIYICVKCKLIVNTFITEDYHFYIVLLTISPPPGVSYPKPFQNS